MPSTCEYQVTLFPEVAARVVNVNAENPADAYRKACEMTEHVFSGLLGSKGQPAGPVLFIQYADEINGALVDVSEDKEHVHSVYLNKFGHQEFTDPTSHCSCPELTVAASNINIVLRSLGDDWLARKLQSALDEIRDVAAVIRSRDDEDDRNQRKAVPQ